MSFLDSFLNKAKLMPDDDFDDFDDEDMDDEIYYAEGI